MKPRVAILYSQGLSNNAYPKPNQSNVLSSTPIIMLKEFLTFWLHAQPI